jgi:hypothetical protein
VLVLVLVLEERRLHLSPNGFHRRVRGTNRPELGSFEGEDEDEDEFEKQKTRTRNPNP